MEGSIDEEVLRALGHSKRLGKRKMHQVGRLCNLGDTTELRVDGGIQRGATYLEVAVVIVV